MLRVCYKLIHEFFYKCQRLFSIIHTKFRLVGNGVIYNDYRIVGTPIIHVGEHGKIVFGDNVQMNNGLMDNQIGFNSPCVFRAEYGAIIIGDNVGLSQSTLIAKNADIILGANVKIGGGVKIYTTDFHSLNYEDRRDWLTDKEKVKSASVEIGDDCFIGAGTIILKGVRIGSRAVIGAGSVVTKDIPSDSISAGNPCKVLRG